MTQFMRDAKPGSDWTQNELAAYNIEVSVLREREFFGTEANNSLEHVNKTLLNYEFIPGVLFPRDVERIIPYLDMASKGTSGQESAVGDFARELLRLMGFETNGRIIRNSYSLNLIMSGVQTSAQTDVCVINMNGDTLLLVQEDKRLEKPMDPEPQVIAGAIAAFQNNNRTRLMYGGHELESMTIPCITMVGTTPRFYLVPVTKDLSDYVARGYYPDNNTIVRSHFPKVPRRVSDGMKPKENRTKILQCYEEFKRFVDELERLLEAEE